jgi:hypothetical protein
MTFRETAAWLFRASMQIATSSTPVLRFAFSPQRVVTSMGYAAPLLLERTTHPDAETASGAA